MRPGRGGERSFLLGLLSLLLLQGCGGAATECFADWQCAGPQCAQVMGGYSGTAGPFSSSDECEQWRQEYILSSTCSCGTGGSDTPAATLTSLLVSPSTPVVPLGATLQMTATGSYSDGSTQDLTAQVTWSQGFIGRITIGPGGLVTALQIGTTPVSASLSGLTASTTVTVGAAVLQSISIAPVDPTIPLGATQAFTATGVYSDGSTVSLPSATWDSGTPDVATLSPGAGGGSVVASAVGVGVTTITASWGGLTGSTALTVTPVALVSVTVTPADAYTALGLGARFAAIGTYSDGTSREVTTLAIWSAAPPSTATVSADGLATGLAPGYAVITARFEGLAGTATLQVSNATLQSIAVTPQSPRVAPAGTQAFTATGTFSDGVTSPLTAGVTWTSSAPGVATIDATGAATAAASGVTTITATSGALEGTSSLTVTMTGTRWIPRSSAVALSLAAVAWTDSGFVAVGEGGTVLTSPDGVAWASQSSGTTAALSAVTWSGTRVVAVGAAGTIVTSPDGVAWTSQASGTTASLGGVAWSGTQFVAVGSGGTILTSPDAIAWTSRSAGTTLALSGVAWNGALFVAVGGVVGPTSSSGTALASTDGVTWATPQGSFSDRIGVTSTATSWAAVGARLTRNIRTGAVTRSGSIETSLDATAWTTRVCPTASSLYAVVWTGQELVAVGAAGTILASPDGTSWLSRTSGTAEDLRGVAWSGTTFVAVGSQGTILSSP